MVTEYLIGYWLVTDEVLYTGLVEMQKLEELDD